MASLLRWRERLGAFRPPAGHVVTPAPGRLAVPAGLSLRPVGRIAGAAWAPGGMAAVGAFRACLGATAETLVVEGRPGAVSVRRVSGDSDDGCAVPMVADWDACWLDDRPVRSLLDWWSIVGADCLASVEGAFALAWLGPDGAVHLARDAPGERTLYYAPVGGGVLFASTIHALIATGRVDRVVDVVGLASYLSCAYVPGSRSLVEGVREVLPGEQVDIRPASIRCRAFWRHPGDETTGTVSLQSERLARERLRVYLERAVARRLPTISEPVAATLSGGIDSSAVVAIARRLHDGPLHTYAASFGARYPNELAYSSLVATHCATSHHIVEMTPKAVLRNLDAVVSLLSKPIGDPLTVPNAVLFREASRQARIVLNGEGGDPCFGGPKNLPLVLAQLYAGVTPGHERFSWERAYLRVHQKAYDDLGRALAPDIAAVLATGLLEESLHPYFEDPRWSTLVNRLMEMNVVLKGAHHILVKVDQISAAFGVLGRSPLFDRSVMEQALSLPPQMKLRGSTEKYILKQAVADLLPRAVVDRPKSGMRVPVEGWFAGPLGRHARERLLDGLAPSGLIRRDYLLDLLSTSEHRYRRRRGVKIWLLITLEAWLRTVLAAEPPVRSSTATNRP